MLILQLTAAHLLQAKAAPAKPIPSKQTPSKPKAPAQNGKSSKPNTPAKKQVTMVYMSKNGEQRQIYLKIKFNTSKV